MPIALNGSSSGKVTLQAAAAAANNTLTLPNGTGTLVSTADTGTVTQTMLGTNVAGNGPAFGAYLGTNQTLTAVTFTKLQINTKEFDTNSNFDAVTNYRFTPTVAGYYQINWAVFGNGSTNTSQVAGVLYKNGSAFKYGSWVAGAIAYGQAISTGSALVSMNGSTDYLELYGYLNGTGTLTVTSGNTGTYFSGFLARSA